MRKGKKNQVWVRDSVKTETTGERYALCYLCHHTLTYRTATLDHVLPRARRGGNEIANLKLACVKCNRKKGCLHPYP